MRQIGWVLDHRDDVDSDLSVYHRIPFGSTHSLPARHYFALVWRLSTYGGVIAMRMRQEADTRAVSAQSQAPSPHPAPVSPAQGNTGPSVVPLAAFAMANPDLVSRKRVPRG